jgi:hypothetical protein
MDQPLKKIVAVLIVVFIFSIAYYGNFLPLRMSQTFIDTLRGLQAIKSLQGFEDSVSVPLDIPSPIGKEELVRNVASVVMNLVQQNDKPEVIAEVIKFLDHYYDPIIARGVGMSFEQNLYVLGTINQFAFVKTNDVNYFKKAKQYYEQGLALGPNRPQFLYGVFDIYRTEGNVEKSKEVADKILTQWPDDQRIRDGLAKFLDFIAHQPTSTGK